MAARRGPGGRFLPRGASVDRYGRLRWRDSRGRYLPGQLSGKLSDIYLGRLKPGDPGWRSAWTYYQMYRAYQTGKWPRETVHGGMDISDRFERWWTDHGERDVDYFDPQNSKWARTRQFMIDPEQATQGGADIPPAHGCEVTGEAAITPHSPKRPYWPEGYAIVETDWVTRPPRRPAILIHPTRRDVYCESRERYLQTAPVQSWSESGGWTPDQLGEALVYIARKWGIRPTTPGATAWRVFRQYLTSRLPVIPEEMLDALHQTHADYVILPPRCREATVFRYDLTCAYGGWLAFLPDLGLGEWVWQETNTVVTMVGIYRCQRWNPESGRYAEPAWVPGSALVWGYGVPYYDGRRAEITGVWRWAGEVSGYSPFAEFVRDCLDVEGIPPHIAAMVKRLPAYLVGKAAQRAWRTPYDPEGVRVMEVSQYYYPVLWAHVVGGLEAYMRRVLWEMGEAITYAYMDTVHTIRPLSPSLLGSAPLGWRLEEGPVPVRYQAVGRWESPTTRKHQGTPD